SILYELGYKCFFRRVSYQPNQPYGHVYDVVPKTQKTANLPEGYYTIDGTLNINVAEEPTFHYNSDLPVMDRMNHYISNAPKRGLGNDSTQDTNTSGGTKSFDWGKIFDGKFFNNLWNSIKGLFAKSSFKESNFNNAKNN